MRDEGDREDILETFVKSHNISIFTAEKKYYYIHETKREY